MVSQFRAARLKIKRANKHIEDIETIVSALPESYIGTIEQDPHIGTCLVYRCPDQTEITENLSLIIGDAIHNTRTAIDYAYAGAIKRYIPDINDRFTKFPVFQTREDLAGALRGKEIDTLCPSLFKAVVSDIKPYKIPDGGNSLLCWLHDIDISDKHILLIPLLHASYIKGLILEDQRGRSVTGNTWPIKGSGPFISVIEPGCKVKDKGEFSISMSLDIIPLLQSVPIPGILKDFTKVAIYIIDVLKSV